MAFNGGDLVELKCSNPEVGSMTFEGVGGEDTTIVLGGYENEDNGAVTGRGNLLISKNRKAGANSFVVANNMAANNPEFEFAKQVQNAIAESVWTATFANREVYKGRGVIVGTVELSVNKNTMTIKVNSGLGFQLQ